MSGLELLLIFEFFVLFYFFNNTLTFASFPSFCCFLRSVLYYRRASQKLQKLLEEHILPVGREITQAWESTLHEVESDEVQDSLERDLEGLKFAFVYYAHLKPKGTKTRATAGTPGTYLTMDEFIHAMQQTGLLINSENQVDLRGSHLTMQRAQECFVAANSHSSRLQRKNTAAAEERSFRQMEFVSVCC